MIYKIVHVETQRAFDIFPEPQLPPKELTFKRIGGFLHGSLESGARQFKPKRGRPKTQTGDLDKVIQNEFRRRRDAGLLPKKREAVIQEAMDWSHKILSKEISRSTAQRVLKPLFDVGS